MCIRIRFALMLLRMRRTITVTNTANTDTSQFVPQLFAERRKSEPFTKQSIFNLTTRYRGVILNRAKRYDIFSYQYNSNSCDRSGRYATLESHKGKAKWISINVKKVSKFLKVYKTGHLAFLLFIVEHKMYPRYNLTKKNVGVNLFILNMPRFNLLECIAFKASTLGNLPDTLKK